MPTQGRPARSACPPVTLGHGRGHLYRALLEATAFGACRLLEAANETGEKGEWVAIGGGTKGGLWTQIISGVTGITQRLPEQTVGACYGDAMLAGITCARPPASRPTLWRTYE